LSFDENLLQLGHGELFPLQQEEEAEAIGIGGQPEGFED
jgi:hypothetical protein